MVFSFQNIDLLSVGIAVAATIVLGFTVYITNTKSITNRTFFIFSVVTALWGVVNYFSYKFSSPQLVLWLFRLVLVFAAMQAYFLYKLFLVFPEVSFTFSKKHTYIFIPLLCIAIVAALSPFGFEGLQGNIIAGDVSMVKTGPALGIFAVISIGFVIFAVYELLRKLRKANGVMHKALLILTLGIVCMFMLIITFNLIVATVFADPRFIPYGAFFTLPFVIAVSYTILKEHIFNVKVIGTAVLVFLLSIASFAEILFSNNVILLLFRSGVFLLTLIFGVSLIRGVLREVEQREHIQHLADELEKANKQQVLLIHFITHQIKGFLTKSRNVYSMILEGDLGEVSEPMKELVTEGFNSDTKGIATVQEILNAANIKSGQVTYKMDHFDFAALVHDIVKDLQGAAEKKNISFEVSIPEDNYTLTGDQMQLQNAIKNIIDNAIKYTPSGSVSISLKKEDGMIRFVEKDTGVGITAEDMQHLFTEGGHGKESIKVNVESTGFGLYIVKNIIDAHHGKIWAESEGANKGSTFTIELPIQQH